MRLTTAKSRLGWVASALLAIILRPTLTAAGEFCLLDDDRAALAAFVALIEAAEREISLSYYAIDSGDAPLGLLALLRDAARRGVRVRVLVDGLQSRLPSDFEAMLSESGVVFRMYHPPYEGRPGWLNRRLHHKLLLVDRRSMIVGSRNLQDHHFGLDATNYVDCDAAVAGRVCSEAAGYFDSLWRSEHVRPAGETKSFGFNFVDNLRIGAGPVPRGGKRRARYEAAIRCARRRLDAVVGGSISPPPCVSDVDVCLLHDSGPGKRRRRFQTQVADLIDSARTSIHVESPYPVFSPPVAAALARAGRRGVSMSLLANSLQSTDNVSTYAAYQNRKAELLAQGVELLELCGTDCLHVKTLVIDRRITLLGSYNFDVRSDRLNLELGVVVCDARVARLVVDSRRRRVARSQRISQGRLLPRVGGDAPVVRRLRMRSLQPVVPLYRRSL